MFTGLKTKEKSNHIRSWRLSEGIFLKIGKSAEHSAVIEVDGTLKCTNATWHVLPQKLRDEGYMKLHPEDKFGFSKFKKLPTWKEFQRPTQNMPVSKLREFMSYSRGCQEVEVCLQLENNEIKRQSKDILLSKRTKSDVMLCSYEDLPKPDCLRRQCQMCGTKKLEEKYSAIIDKATDDDEMKWFKWGPINVQKNGKMKRIVSCH